MPLGGIWHQCLLFLLSASLSPKQCRNINLGLWKYVDGSGLRNRNHRLRMTVALSRGLAFIEWRPLIRARYVFRQEACQIFQEWELWSMMMTKDLAKRRSLLALHEAFWIFGEAFFFFFLFVHYLTLLVSAKGQTCVPTALRTLIPPASDGNIRKDMHLYWAIVSCHSHKGSTIDIPSHCIRSSRDDSMYMGWLP